MLNCADSTRLMSEALDRDLSRWQRFGLRMHVLMCSACRRYRRQIEGVERLLLRRGDAAGGAGVLTPERREAIKQALHDGAARPCVLFVCIQNAGRSQMAAAWLRHLGADRAEALSAGSRPAAHVHPQVLHAMAEVGIDLSCATPKRLEPDLLERADLVVTMGCGETCPAHPGVPGEDWALADPADGTPAEVAAIRDLIRKRVLDLLERLEVVTSASGLPSSGIPSSGIPSSGPDEPPRRS